MRLAGHERAVVLVLASAFLPLPAAALDLGMCDMYVQNGDESFSTEPAEDLGGGIVMQEQIHRNGGAGSNEQSFEHCASGKAIRAVYLSSGGQETIKADINPAELVRKAIAAKRVVSLQQLTSQMNRAGAAATLTDSNTETCGCARFYPDLRGTKTPWRWE